jgi:hypothetical protein
MREMLEFGKTPTLPSAHFYEVFRLQDSPFAKSANVNADERYNQLKQDYPEYAQTMDDINRIWRKYLRQEHITFSAKHANLTDLHLRRLGLAGAILLERLYPNGLPLSITRSDQDRIKREQASLETEISQFLPGTPSLKDANQTIIEKLMLGDLKIIPQPEANQQLTFGFKKGSSVLWGFNAYTLERII